MVTIRAARKKDFKAIATLHAKSWRQNYRGVFSDGFLDHDAEKERLSVWKNRFEKPQKEQFVLIAEVDGVLIGFVCGFIDHHNAYGTLIDNLHVDSHYIGQRIGQRLMISAARYLEIQNRTSMYLWVLAGNTKAIRFYERMGGTPLETVNDFDIGDREITKTRYYWSDITCIEQKI